LSKGVATRDGEGNVRAKSKNFVKVEVIQPEKPERADESEKEETAPPAEEPVAPKLVPLETLQGRTIGPLGDIVDDDCNIIGKLVEGNTKR
jgi:hypothetical protein